MVDFNNILSGVTSDYLGFIDNFNLMIKSSIKSNHELNESLRYVFDIINKNNEKENKMTNFKDIIFEKDVVIHCPEEWMANELLKYADSKGYEWNIGESYNNTRWYVNKKSMCYLLGNGTHCSIDHVLNNKDLYTVMKYEDVVIKDETSLNYELVIKGRKAKIGSELWHKDSNGECEKVTIYSITIHDGKNIIIRVENDKKTETKRHWLYDDMFTKGIDDILFWEKPTLYQLPDTDGNLSEVKVGQEVYLTEIAINKTKKHKISKLYDGCIYFNDTSFVWGGVNRLYYKTTTNKPHRDFSDCPHWEDVPKAKYWAVDRDGISYWYYYKPEINEEGTRHGIITSLDYEEAGYRADLLNENGVVEDWEYSLVKRPNNK